MRYEGNRQLDWMSRTSGLAAFVFCLLSALPVTDLAAKAPTVAGIAVFDGTPPERRPVKFTDQKGKLSECSTLHEDALLSEQLIVGENGGIANVFVYVSSGLRRRRYPSSNKPVILNQVGCMFRPRVLGVGARQELTLRNSDPVLHNVRALSFRNRPFNVAQPAGSPDRTKSFRSRETAIMIQCDLHPWMVAHVFVMSHPFFAVTDESGRFDIPELPRGTYTLSAWHEEMGKQTIKINVTDAQQPDIRFTFKLKEKKTKVMQGVLAADSPGAPAGPSATDTAPREFVEKWQLADFETDLAASNAGSAERGRAVFESAGCSKCHVFSGKGAKFGPELTDIKKRFTGNKLLQQILTPSVEINKDFKTQLFLTEQGTTVAGLVVKEADGNVHVLPNPLKPEDVVILPVADIQLRRESSVSTMPEGLLNTYTKQEVLDLVQYLQSAGTPAE